MPHIIVEYSAPLLDDVAHKALLKALHKRVADEPSVDIKAVKTRSYALENVIVGDDDMPDWMIAITIKLLEGRSVEVRKQLSLDVLKIVRDIVEQFGKSETAVTVEVAEMVKETFSK